MFRYLIRRVLYMIPTLFGMSLVSFLIIQLPPGDYLSSLVATMSENGQTVDPDQIARLKQVYGLGDPFYVQYWKWIWGILSRGDFGYYRCQSWPLASRDPSARALSFAQAICEWTRPPRPQSVPAMTFSRPTTLA